MQKKFLLTSILHGVVLGIGFLMCSYAASAQSGLPGAGVAVTPIKSSIAEETFQTILVSRALERLGYTVKDTEVAEYVIAYQSLASGNASFMAASWAPLHDNFYNAVGGDDALYREGVYSDSALQGYVIDKATAEKYGISNMEQLKDPRIAKLFDVDGNGKADLFGCTSGWGCQETIDHQISAYGLKDSVDHKTGSYAALIAEVISRYKAGKPILYYTWTPYWVSAELVIGKDVVWLQVPFSSLPETQKSIDTQWPNGRNYGFPMNTQQIVANKDFAQKNPAAAKLFSIMYLPVDDINMQNLRMKAGENQPKDIERHVDAWIETHQDIFDGWIQEAIKAAN